MSVLEGETEAGNELPEKPRKYRVLSKQVVNRWLGLYEAKGVKGINTVKTYARAIRLFDRFLEENGATGEVKPSDIETEHVTAFYFWMKRKGYSLKTMRIYLVALKSFLTFMHNNKVQWKVIQIPPAESYDYRIMTREQVEAVIGAAYALNDTYGVMLHLAYEGAFRESELVNLRICDVNTKNCTVLKRSLKREKPVEIPVSDRLCRALKWYLHAVIPVLRNVGDPCKEYLFVTKTGKKWDRSNFIRLVYYPSVVLASKVAPGLLDRNGKPRFRYHDFARHTRATLLLKKGTDIYTVKKLLGHKSIQTTTIYLHLTSADELKERGVVEDLEIPDLSTRLGENLEHHERLMLVGSEEENVVLSRKHLRIIHGRVTVNPSRSKGQP